MNPVCKLSLKIDLIEFIVEGSEAFVEKEKEYFLNNILPSLKAVRKPLNESSDEFNNTFLKSDSLAKKQIVNISPHKITSLSLNETLNKFEGASQADQALVLIKYAIENQEQHDVGSVDLKVLFREAKIKAPKNPSDILNKLVQKGFIQKSSEKSNKFILTQSGINYLSNLAPHRKKDVNSSLKPKRNVAIKSARYQKLSKEQLNLEKFPLVKDQKEFKAKLLLTLYIVSSQGLGDEFSINDCVYLVKDRMGEKASYGQVAGIFRRNSYWFTESEDSLQKGGFVRKLLNPAIDFAKDIINKPN